MTRLSVVFFSHLKGKGYKAPRLRGYFPTLKQYDIISDFYGLPPDPAFEDRPEGLDNYYGYRSATIASSQFSNLGGKFGVSSLGRYVGTHVICSRAKADGCLREKNGLFTQPYMWPLVRAAKNKNIPVILESDSDYPLFNWNIVNERSRINALPRTTRDPWNFWPYVKMAMHSIDAADGIVVFSDHAYETYLQAGIGRDKLILASPPPSQSCTLASSSSTKPEFVWAGNHGVRKGLDLMISAWSRYKSEGGIGCLHVCGEITPAQVKLRQRIAQLPEVTDHGRIPFINFLIEKRRVIINPSFSEGLPRTVMEALACGSPVIASKASAGTFVIPGKSGWICDLSSESIVDCLRDAAIKWNDLEKFGNAGSELVRHETANYFHTVARAIKNNIAHGTQ